MEKYCKSCGRVFKDSDFRICPYCGNQLSTRIGRQPIPRKLRHQVFQRDGYRCRECGATNKETQLHVDHIKPVAKGGTNDLSNLQTLCEECNRAKYTDEWVGGAPLIRNKQNLSDLYEDAKNINKKNINNAESFKITEEPTIDSKRLRSLYVDKTKYNVCNNCDMVILKKYKSCPYCGSEDIKLTGDDERRYQQKKTQKKLLGVCPKCNTSVTKYMENKTIMKCPKCGYSFIF